MIISQLKGSAFNKPELESLNPLANFYAKFESMF
jgi:hypothetical protein